jgi:hypothetical protein
MPVFCLGSTVLTVTVLVSEGIEAWTDFINYRDYSFSCKSEWCMDDTDTLFFLIEDYDDGDEEC